MDPSIIGRALAERLAQIEAAARRFDAFAFEPEAEPPPEALGPGERLGATRDLLLRVLAVASDPLSYAMLLRLVEGDAPLGELAALVRLPRLSAWERVNDLVQVGLVRRSLERDAAGLTEMGRTLVVAVEAAAEAGGGEGDR